MSSDTGPGGIDVNAAWRRLMTLQTDLLFPAELPFYVRSSAWQQATDVIDIGTGNGYYLARLSSIFTNKNYTGIDFNNAHISVAMKRNEKSEKNLQFKCVNFYDLIDTYDAAIARLCIQHQPSLHSFADQVRNIIRPGGSLFVVESNDEDRTFRPEVSIVNLFFQHLRANRRNAGQDRDAGVLLEDVATQYGLHKMESSIVTTCSEMPNAKELFRETYTTVADVVKTDFGMDFDYASLKDEINKWYENKNSYTHLSVNIARYERRKE